MLRTMRLCLRPLSAGDVPRIAELGGDWDVASMTSRMAYPYSLSSAAQWLEAQGEGEVVRGIFHDDELIGICGYLPDGKGHAEIGYWIGKDYWGRGFATEAARALISHGFRVGRFDEITCGHFHDNPASRRVIEKLGFELVGPCHCWCEARRVDTPAIRYRLARPSAWQNLSAPFKWLRAG